ncbi:hypothetical protein P6709_06810 [Jeotgalibacillus sp. ET6]|uniref:DUF6843 domain-containing protein n=1 Tax=Jeotgalibacillus sp. ET6 TaxID=3037260 RepID=UPI0024187A61|nr:hypothetical protein [Jeotgalibacillus sp. ET6]MDG5471452.1 hypothetical protein [Jeotgalibacillus sp. ET6]
MKRILKKMAILIVTSFLVFALYLLYKPDETGAVIYVLPEGFDKCVSIDFDVRHADPLVLDDEGAVIYNIPMDGEFKTSSSSDFGHIGIHQIFMQFQNKDGRKSELIDVTISSHSSYSYGEGGTNLAESGWISFNSIKQDCEW